MSQAFILSPNRLKQPTPQIAETMPGPARKRFIFKNKDLKNTIHCMGCLGQEVVRIFAKKN